MNQTIIHQKLDYVEMPVLPSLDLCPGRNSSKVPRHDRMRNHLVWGDAVTGGKHPSLSGLECWCISFCITTMR